MSKDSSATFYQKRKKKTCGRYQDVSEEKKQNVKYGCEQCKHFPEHDQQRLVKYRKNIIIYGKTNPFHK